MVNDMQSLQIIGVTGVNPTGGCLLASALHTSAPAPLPATTPDQLARLARRTGVLCSNILQFAQLECDTALEAPLPATPSDQLARLARRTGVVFA